MPKYQFVIILALLITTTATASDPYPKNEAIDVLHYKFTIQLNDTSNLIDAHTEITILAKKPVNAFSLDLIGKNKLGYGMSVTSVFFRKNPLKFSHRNGRLEISLGGLVKENEEVNLEINYSGIPSDGLVIGKNKFGDRTFFGENWPDKARHWLPSIDHPYEKASCEFIIIAPDHYQAIANGVMIERTSLPQKRTLTHWKEDIVIPTKLMVIGVARFAITTAGVVDGTPVETWVYPQNREAGFYDFKIAPAILKYLIDEIAPFPYKKLANVQSTTRFGGMENASNIFYDEYSVTGDNKKEGVIAHEIAHQWFGDSASELDWHHVWLSEGFATYFTNLYYEFAYGRDSLVKRMQDQRKKVTDYYSINKSPVVDTTIADISKVLSTNTYQKASWVLHMLRKEVGDEMFRKGVRSYYQQYQNSNALTDDFRTVMEEVSGKDLKSFFNQWIWTGGHPELSGIWTYDQRRKLVRINIVQNQDHLFETPLEIGIVRTDGSIAIQTVNLVERKSEYAFSEPKSPKDVILDPGTWLLFTGQIKPK